MSAYRKIASETGNNLTSRLYKQNENKCWDELRLTQQIEDYVSGATGNRVRFRLKRCEILTDAVIGFLRKPGSAQWNTVKKMAKEAPPYGWLYIPCVLIRKVVLR